MREPCCIPNLFWVLRELLPVGVGFGECLYLMMPVPLPRSCVSLSGTGMDLSLQQSLIPHVQPQLPQTVFSMPGISGRRAKSRFLAPCSTCWSALHPSLSPMAVFSLPCVPSCSATSIASRWLVLELSPCFLLPQNVQPWILLMGPGA